MKSASLRVDFLKVLSASEKSMLTSSKIYEVESGAEDILSSLMMTNFHSFFDFEDNFLL